MRVKSKRSLQAPERTYALTGRKTKIALAALLPCLTLCPPARAEVFVARYVVNLDGLRIGDALLRIAWDAKHYKVVVSADIGMLLVSTQIQGEASGKRSGSKLTPEHFQLVMSGGQQGATAVNFATSAEAAANGAARLRGVFDPLSALLAVSLKPASPPNHPCKTVLPIFTGHDRFDLNLRLKAGGSAQKESALIFCQAAVNGQNSPDWELAFSKVTKPHFWLVEHISLPTEKGIVTIDRAQTSISSP